MNWRDFISGVYAKRDIGDGIEGKPFFHPPASVQDITDVESHFKTQLPMDLQSLLHQTNGIMGMLKIDDGDWLENNWLIWPISEIVHQNSYFRAEWSTLPWKRCFDDVLFFASAGTDGILFAHCVENHVATPNVVAWSPGAGELTPIAPTLRDFIEGWLLDRILF